MTDSGSRLRAFVAELRRRRVFRVAAVYAVVAFVVLQVADIAFPALGLPDWTTTFVVVVALLGFPVALALAWAFDITPEGVQRTEPLTGETPSSPKERSMLLAATTVVAVTALAVGAGWVLLHDRVTASPDTRKSIAVLPFANMSADPENEYFSEGITDDIITQLSKISGLKVISRTSVLKYEGSNKGIPEIAEELGVDAILEGGVRRVEDRVRINAQLIDAQTDEHLWADTYDRELQDIFAIQTDVAQQIATALEATLTPTEKEQIETKPTKNLEAYNYYLRGNEYLAGRLGESDTDMAVEMYEIAVALDPEFSLAVHRLSEAYASSYWAWRMRLGVLGEGYLDELAELSLSSFGSDTPAYYLSRAILFDRTDEQGAANANFDSARTVLERRVDTRPTEPSFHAQLGLAYAGLGRADDAIREGKTAMELLPVSVDPYAGGAWAENLAHIYVMLGEHDAAIEQIESLLTVASPLSTPWLQADPTWDPLRDRPRFRLIIEGGA